MEAKITYTEKLVRQSVWCFMKRTVGIPFALAMLALGIWSVWQLTGGDQSLPTLLLAALVVVFAIFVSYGFWAHLSQSLQKIRAMSPPEALLRAEEHQITFVSSLGTSIMPWSSIKQIWQFENVWLLLFSKSQFSSLPLECLDAEMRAYLVDRVKSAGGTVS